VWILSRGTDYNEAYKFVDQKANIYLMGFNGVGHGNLLIVLI